MGRKAKIIETLDDDLSEWYEWMLGSKNNMAKVTGMKYIRRVKEFEKLIGYSRFDLMDLGPQEVQDRTTKLIDKLKEWKFDHKKNKWYQKFDENGLPIVYSPAYVGDLLKGIYCYFRFIKFDINKKDIGKPDNMEFTPTLENLAVPNQKDVKKILSHAPNERDKAIISLVAFLGIRPITLGNSDGTNGIIFEDLLDFDMKTRKFTERPPRIRIRSHISKNRMAYFGLLCDEGVAYLEDYFRIFNGEMTEYTPIIGHNRATYNLDGDEVSRVFLTTKAISQRIRFAIQAAGLKNRPYDLRNYFAHRVEIFMPPSKATYLMGHKGNMTARYTNPIRFPQDKLEEMRKQFRDGQKHLQTDITKIQVEEMEAKYESMENRQEGMRELFELQIEKSKKEKKNMEREIRTLRRELDEQRKLMMEFVRDINRNGLNAKPRDNKGQVVNVDSEQSEDDHEFDLPPKYK